MIAAHVELTNCEVGYATYINKNTILYCSKIGKYCSIGENVRGGFGQHPLNYISTHPSFFYDTNSQLGWTFFDPSQRSPYNPYRYCKGEDKFLSKIGHDVWIGSHAMLMDGITIGTGAVIGAGSVVTKDVPPYAIVAGVPARIIKYRHSPETIKCLLESKWWEMTFEEIESIKDKYNINHLGFK